MDEIGGAAAAPTLRERIVQENRAAKAERLAAQQEHRAKTRPAKGAGWSTKKPKRPGPSQRGRELAKARQARAEAGREQWRLRHPELAASERALRLQRAALREDWSHKAQGTPQTHEHARRRPQGAIERLWQSGAIDDDAKAYAEQICAIAEHIVGDVLIRTASLETRVDVQRRGDGTFYERIALVWSEVAYGNWRRRLGADAAPVLEVIVNDVPLTEIARRHRMHNRRARHMLQEALQLWPQYLAGARNEIDEAELAGGPCGPNLSEKRIRDYRNGHGKAKNDPATIAS